MSSHPIPGLTTAAQPIYALGQTAVEILLRHLSDLDAAPETIMLETRLVVRKSTAPPKQTY